MGAKLVAGAALSVAVVWLGVNVYPYDVPEPLWTEADLPAAPTEADNGWSVFVADPADLEIPKPLTAILDDRDPDGAKFWQRVELEADLLGEFLATEAARESNQTLAAASQQPTFAIHCSSQAPCPMIQWRRAHQAGVLRAIELARTDDVIASATLLRALIEIDTAHLEDAKTLLDIVVALENLSEALANADMLAARLDPSTDASAAVNQLSIAVGRVAGEPLDLRKFVIAEYLFTVEILDALTGRTDRASSPVPERFDNGAMPRWLLNRALTLRCVNERYQRRYEGAAEGDTTAAIGGGEPALAAQWGWWFRNPAGKHVIDLMNFDGREQAASVDETLAEIEQTRTRFLARPAVLALD